MTVSQAQPRHRPQSLATSPTAWPGTVRCGLSQLSPCPVGSPSATVCDFGGIADVNRQVVVGRRATYTHTHRGAHRDATYIYVWVYVLSQTRLLRLFEAAARASSNQQLLHSFIIVKVMLMGTYGCSRYWGSLLDDKLPVPRTGDGHATSLHVLALASATLSTILSWPKQLYGALLRYAIILIIIL